MFRKRLWKYLIRRAAHAHGYLDPFSLFTRLSRFAQPAEVIAPTELLRAGAVLHARGLLNAQVIQHNLDWLWPYWVNRQFDPTSVSFIPRAFSLTHINMTHRNWTAVGLPDVEDTPLVDPSGLLMPFWDSWSVEVWICNKQGHALIPSRCAQISQSLDMDSDDLRVMTTAEDESSRITTSVHVVRNDFRAVCRMNINVCGADNDLLVIAVRPYNPEGISLIQKIAWLKDTPGFLINTRDNIFFDRPPEYFVLSDYEHGDVFHSISLRDANEHMSCPHEMATAAVIYRVRDIADHPISVDIPLERKKKARQTHPLAWKDVLVGTTQISIPDSHFEFLFNAAVRTLIIHSAVDVYAGPYCYKRFWFRDAVYITYALISCGFHDRAEKIIDQFEKRQKNSGYFESQEGEWDSNGQVLWLIGCFYRVSNRQLKPEWKKMIYKAAEWILKKRLSKKGKFLQAGLLPAGFSAEHFGPNDYYYWDNFWSVAGLDAAQELACHFHDTTLSERYAVAAIELREAIDASLSRVKTRFETAAMPSSPYRRLDSASIGSLVAGYPLQLFERHDPRLKDTADYLLKECCVHDGFFHQISHSGINPYLTLHLAQVFMRAGDTRYSRLITGIARLASSTGQWPEAIHPNTLGGCMGDGQHVWAAAEWLLVMRNMFIREETAEDTLVLCAGIYPEWIRAARPLCFGPAWTSYGKISVTVTFSSEFATIDWEADWHTRPKVISVEIPGLTAVQTTDCEGPSLVKLA